VVVLCKREKLEMEDMFRRTIPEVARYGTRFVFRQVSSWPGEWDCRAGSAFVKMFHNTPVRPWWISHKRLT